MRSRSELSNDEDPCMANKHEMGKTAFNIREMQVTFIKRCQYILYKIIKSSNLILSVTIKDLKQLQLLFIAGYNKEYHNQPQNCLPCNLKSPSPKSH